MTVSLRKFTLLVVLPALGALLLLTGPAVGTAQAGACAKWGDKRPSRLTHAQARAAVKCFVNRARHNRGLRRVRKQRRLDKAAHGHDRYMVRHRCFSHQCGGEPSLDQRLRNAGYIHGGLSRWGYGENLAALLKGHGTPRHAVRAWMHSREHRANLLHGSFHDIGVGFMHGTPSHPNGRGGTYTVDLAYRR